jgi:hypothetical protein
LALTRFAAFRAPTARSRAGIIGNGIHMPSQSIHRAVNIRRSAGPKRKVPPFGGTSRIQMRDAKVRA